MLPGCRDLAAGMRFSQDISGWLAPLEGSDTGVIPVTLAFPEPLPAARVTGGTAPLPG